MDTHIESPNPLSTTDHNHDAHSQSPPPSSSSPIRDPNPSPTEENLHVELQTQLELTDEKPEEAATEEKEWDGWNDYGDEFKSGDEGEGEDRDNENENVVSDEKNERSNGYKSHYQPQYPVRPDSEDCSFYMKTGTCKFGSNCKFNHPVRRKNQAAKDKVKEGQEGMEKPGQAECKYYLKTGGCKFGKACRYNHSTAKAPVAATKPLVFRSLEVNFIGLPIRPEEKECPYYMRNGSCKYGANCRFNHPDPIAVGGSDSPASFGNGVSTSLHGASPPNAASWSSPKAVNEPAPYVPIMFPPTQVAPSQNANWNGYQASVYPPERSMHPLQAFVISNPSVESNVYGHHQQQIGNEFPERPGEPECSFFMKTGDCKFKLCCKYHHPKNRISKSPLCAFSDKGLPLRPGQNACSHYSRYGICKFGPACKFDHPIQPVSAAVSGDNQPVQPVPFGNSARTNDARPLESRHGTDNAIQQAV